jgi:hypothetical protein
MNLTRSAWKRCTFVSFSVGLPHSGPALHFIFGEGEDVAVLPGTAGVIVANHPERASKNRADPTFPEAMSFGASLSRLSPATNRFSFPFSGSSSLSRQA